ncbi:UNVERIFIED_CONTAM: phosphatidylinositol-4-phosphate 5-Kinase [Hammondia hammondi]|eukprot:XP_008883277.1 phosphatidylinositol-4-phosphate 5-Kinase [Hammondia hammondi]
METCVAFLAGLASLLSPLLSLCDRYTFVFFLLASVEPRGSSSLSASGACSSRNSVSTSPPSDGEKASELLTTASASSAVEGEGSETERDDPFYHSSPTLASPASPRASPAKPEALQAAQAFVRLSQKTARVYRHFARRAALLLLVSCCASWPAARPRDAAAPIASSRALRACGDAGGRRSKARSGVGERETSEHAGRIHGSERQAFELRLAAKESERPERTLPLSRNEMRALEARYLCTSALPHLLLHREGWEALRAELVSVYRHLVAEMLCILKGADEMASLVEVDGRREAEHPGLSEDRLSKDSSLLYANEGEEPFTANLREGREETLEPQDSSGEEQQCQKREEQQKATATLFRSPRLDSSAPPQRRPGLEAQTANGFTLTSFEKQEKRVFQEKNGSTFEATQDEPLERRDRSGASRVTSAVSAGSSYAILVAFRRGSEQASSLLQAVPAATPGTSRTVETSEIEKAFSWRPCLQVLAPPDPTHSLKALHVLLNDEREVADNEARERRLQGGVNPAEEWSSDIPPLCTERGQSSGDRRRDSSEKPGGLPFLSTLSPLLNLMPTHPLLPRSPASLPLLSPTASALHAVSNASKERGDKPLPASHSLLQPAAAGSVFSPGLASALSPSHSVRDPSRPLSPTLSSSSFTSFDALPPAAAYHSNEALEDARESLRLSDARPKHPVDPLEANIALPGTGDIPKWACDTFQTRGETSKGDRAGFQVGASRGDRQTGSPRGRLGISFPQNEGFPRDREQVRSASSDGNLIVVMKVLPRESRVNLVQNADSSENGRVSPFVPSPSFPSVALEVSPSVSSPPPCTSGNLGEDCQVSGALQNSSLPHLPSSSPPSSCPSGAYSPEAPDSSRGSPFRGACPSRLSPLKGDLRGRGFFPRFVFSPSRCGRRAISCEVLKKAGMEQKGREEKKKEGEGKRDCRSLPGLQRVDDSAEKDKRQRRGLRASKRMLETSLESVKDLRLDSDALRSSHRDNFSSAPQQTGAAGKDTSDLCLLSLMNGEHGANRDTVKDEEGEKQCPDAMPERQSRQRARDHKVGQSPSLLSREEQLRSPAGGHESPSACRPSPASSPRLPREPVRAVSPGAFSRAPGQRSPQSRMDFGLTTLPASSAPCSSTPRHLFDFSSTREKHGDTLGSPNLKRLSSHIFSRIVEAAKNDVKLQMSSQSSLLSALHPMGCQEPCVPPCASVAQASPSSPLRTCSSVHQEEQGSFASLICSPTSSVEGAHGSEPIPKDYPAEHVETREAGDETGNSAECECCRGSCPVGLARLRRLRRADARVEPVVDTRGHLWGGDCDCLRPPVSSPFSLLSSRAVRRMHALTGAETLEREGGDCSLHAQAIPLATPKTHSAWPPSSSSSAFVPSSTGNGPGHSRTLFTSPSTREDSHVRPLPGLLPPQAAEETAGDRRGARGSWRGSAVETLRGYLRLDRAASPRLHAVDDDEGRAPNRACRGEKGPLLGWGEEELRVMKEILTGPGLGSQDDGERGKEKDGRERTKRLGSFSSHDRAGDANTHIEILVKAKREAPEGEGDAKEAPRDTACLVTVFYPTRFHAMRHFLCGDDMRFCSSLRTTHPVRLPGGKSGARFSLSHDGQYVIKQLNKHEMRLWLSEETGSALFRHVSETFFSEEPTTLTALYGLFQLAFPEKKTKEFYIVMENMRHMRAREDGFLCRLQSLSLLAPLASLLLPRSVPQSQALGSRLSETRQDLTFPVSPPQPSPSAPPAAALPVLWDQNFREFSRGFPLCLESSDHAWLWRALQRDTQLLQKLEVVDYSLLVLVEEGENCRRISLALIDFFRPYTWDKQMETIGKSLAYMTRGWLDEQPTVLSPPQYRLRFLHTMAAFFGPAHPTDLTSVFASLVRTVPALPSLARTRDRESRPTCRAENTKGRKRWTPLGDDADGRQRDAPDKVKKRTRSLNAPHSHLASNVDPGSVRSSATAHPVSSPTASVATLFASASFSGKPNTSREIFPQSPPPADALSRSAPAESIGVSGRDPGENRGQGAEVTSGEQGKAGATREKCDGEADTKVEGVVVGNAKRSNGKTKKERKARNSRVLREIRSATETVRTAAASAFLLLRIRDQQRRDRGTRIYY